MALRSKKGYNYIMVKAIDKDVVENIVLKNNVIERSCSDVRYAPMWVKLVITWAGSILVGALLVAIANSVIKK
jgi:hypothetical protein